MRDTNGAHPPTFLYLVVSNLEACQKEANKPLGDESAVAQCPVSASCQANMYHTLVKDNGLPTVLKDSGDSGTSGCRVPGRQLGLFGGLGPDVLCAAPLQGRSMALCELFRVSRHSPLDMQAHVRRAITKMLLKRSLYRRMLLRRRASRMPTRRVPKAGTRIRGHRRDPQPNPESFN